MILVVGDVLRTFSIRLLKSFFRISVCLSLVSFVPAWRTTAPMFFPFRIAGTCAATSRTRAPGKQRVRTLPLAVVARTCRTMESPMITASLSDSRSGAKRFLVEISKTGGGGGGEVLARVLARVFRCCCIQAPWYPGAGVNETWAGRDLGALGLDREIRGVEVLGVFVSRRGFTWDRTHSALGSSSKAVYSPPISTISSDIGTTTSTVPNHFICCPPTPAVNNQSATVSLQPSTNQSMSDSSSPAPTMVSINRKAKSRGLDKDSRSRNRLSHTSSPLSLSKSKKIPLPSDMDTGGNSNRLPGPRRQRSTHTQVGHFLPSLNELYIVETNQELKTLNCASSHSCSYTLFLHGSQNSSMNHITLHMRFSEIVWVRQCSVTRGRLCPNHTETDFSVSKGAFTKGTSHLWSVPLASVQHVAYHFRVSIYGDMDCSGSEEQKMQDTTPFTDYYFLIQSRCT